MPTIQELKDYLGIDGGQSDAMLADFLNAARELIEGILRYQVALLNPTPPLVKEALKFTVAYLYSGREQANIQELERTLRIMLQSIRKKEF